MEKIKSIIQHIAPTLSAALDGPFSGVATKFITDHLGGDATSNGQSSEKVLHKLLDDAENLIKIKEIDQQFKLEMEKLGVDIFSMAVAKAPIEPNTQIRNLKPQIIISTLFLVAYFLMIGAIFAVEVSDTANMVKGENSLMGELQILFGVLTAGVGQILSFWFGGLLNRNNTLPS